MEARTIGVMGGTFDPIHLGHLLAASEVADRFKLDTVIFVPTGHPSEKLDRVVATPEDRYLMTAIATASDSRFEVSRVDIDRPGPTYSVDTLLDLRHAHPEGTDFVFIAGADAASQIMNWHDPERLLTLARFVGVTRPGQAISVQPEDGAGVMSFLDIPALDISSTDIRDRVRTGRSIDDLVPEGVASHIRKTGLYRDGR